MPAGGGHHRPGLQHDLFSVGAVASLGDYHGHDCVTDLYTGGDTRANLVNDPGRIHARHVRGRIGLLLFGAGAVTGHGIGRVHRCGVHTQAHLTGPGVNPGQIDDLQCLRAAVNENAYCAHVIRLSWFVSGSSRPIKL